MPADSKLRAEDRRTTSSNGCPRQSRPSHHGASRGGAHYFLMAFLAMARCCWVILGLPIHSYAFDAIVRLPKKMPKPPMRSTKSVAHDMENCDARGGRGDAAHNVGVGRGRKEGVEPCSVQSQQHAQRLRGVQMRGSSRARCRSGAAAEEPGLDDGCVAQHGIFRAAPRAHAAMRAATGTGPRGIVRAARTWLRS